MSFEESVVYQIYPKSFKDSTGTGVGDLRGIIEKVPYIASLGVDYVWFSPFFPSPQRDNGYDISDYCDIDPAMGTMEDFDELVGALGRHGIGVMLDMVLNHTSTDHEWFQRALAGEKKYQDYYYIRPPKADGSLPTNWVSKFGGPAWAPFGDTGDYYLHLYDLAQADLDWHNPEVRAELIDVVNFWRSRGVHGFRFDVINVIGKDAELLDAPAGSDDRKMYTDGPDVHAYLRELNESSFGRDADSITVGEMSSTSVEACVGYSNPRNRELNMVFSFHHLKVDYKDGEKWTSMPFDMGALKRVLNEWAVGMQEGEGWNALFWNNHDQPRAINRFGDPGRYRVESATMLATVIHLLRGTPFVYMGEEIGMTDPGYTQISDYVDVEAHNAYAELVESGCSEQEAFAIVRGKARDNARTPMQWDLSEGAGFTAGTPWLRPTGQDRINVEEEESAGRILPYYRRLIALRKECAVVSRGTYEPYAMDHADVYAYIREHEGQRLLVLTNFRPWAAEIAIPEEFLGGEVLISNYSQNGVESRPGSHSTPDSRPDLDSASGSGPAPEPGSVDDVEPTLTLRPYEALAILIHTDPLGE